MLSSRTKHTLHLELIWLAALLLILAPLTRLAAASAHAGQARFVPGQILIKPKAGVNEAEFAAKLHGHGGRQRAAIQKLNIRLVSVDEAKVEAVLAQLRRDPRIEFAERDYLAEAAFTPNDPHLLNGNAWHHAKIQAPAAWDTTTGSSNVIVAVLDSGVNAAHPDLAARLVPGYDFVWGDADPADDFGHGTAVAGVVAAAGNNGIGVAGVAFNARVMPVKVMNSSGFAAYSAIAQGIHFAVDRGARVINISIAGTSASAALQDAINYASSSNVIVVAAAGNNGNSISLYPAACSNVVAVSATTANDTLANFSNFGSHLTLSAPGQGIWTTTRDLTTSYAAWNGTSFASPVVAGVAALMMSAKPSLSGAQVISILTQTADDLGAAGFDATFGHGRVNAARAVSAALNANFDTPFASVVSPASGVGVSGQINVEVAAAASTAVTRVECYANGILIGTAAGTNGTFEWHTSSLTNGNYTLQAKAIDAVGNVGYSAGVEVTVVNAPAAPATITGLVPTQNGTLQLTWSAIPNKSYRVQYTTDLANPNWQNYPEEIISTGTNASMTVQTGGLPQCFFRVQSLP